MRIVDLSHPFVTGMPVYPGDPAVNIHPITTVADDGFAVQQVGMPSHAGTHVDAPAHMLADGESLDTLAPSHFVGAGMVLNCPERTIELKTDIPRSLSFVLFRTDWDRHWDTGRYFNESPRLSMETAQRLAATNIKGVGLDFPSPDSMGATCVHEILLKAGIVIIENLRGLDSLPETGFTFSCLPLNILGGDGSPCRAVGMLP